MSAPDRTLLSEEFCQKYPLLLVHLEEVLENNKITNLTGIKDIEAGKVLHIEDSLAVYEELNKAPTGKIADLGSGAGYPGIPLAIVSGRETLLVESNKKKAAFLERFIKKHGLDKQISVAPIRSEELAETNKNEYSVVITRAVSALPTILELCTPLVSNAGHIIAMKGALESSELEGGNKAAQILGLVLRENRDYTIGPDNSNRCVLVYEKIAESEIMLPRRPGMALKRPLA